MDRLNKNINKYHFTVRTIGASPFYISLIFSLIIPKDDFGLPAVKYFVVGFLSIIVLILIVFNFVLPFFIYSLYGYELHEEYIMIKKGVLFRVNDYIPIKRIQHIEKIQGPVQSLFKITALQIFTAGSNNFLIGLSEATVTELVHKIREKLQVYLDSDEVTKDES
jgi:hypothetical protein